MNVRNQPSLKLLLVLLICTTYIFSFSHFGALAYSSIMDKNETFSEHTKVGPLLVAGKTANEASHLLAEEVTKWQSETTVEIQYREKNVPLDISSIEFDIIQTVTQIRQGEQNNLIVNIFSLEELIHSISPSINMSDLDVESLTEELLISAQVLQSGSYRIRLENFLSSDLIEEVQVISDVVIELEDSPKDIHLIENVIIEVGPTSQFSLLKYFKDNQSNNISTNSLSMIGTAIYQLVLPTNFSIIERHTSTELPNYSKLGYEAMVSFEKNKDLLFSNPNEFRYYIDFSLTDSKLVATLKGPKFLNGYSIITEDEESFKPKTIKQFTPQLTGKEFEIANEGKDGLIIKVYREYYDEKGELLQKKLISEDFYPPVHRVEYHPLSGGTVKEPDGDSVDLNTEDNDSGQDTDEESDDEDFYDRLKDLKDKEIEDNDLWGKPDEQAK